MAKETKNKESQISNTLIYLIATSQKTITRTDLAEKTGLSKMTISNHINDLIQMGIISEQPTNIVYDHSTGRKAIPLQISSSSPCILGILIKREFCQSILADVSGKIIDMTQTRFSPHMTRDEFIQIPIAQYEKLFSRARRPLIGCGISCVGPVDNKSGYILNPPNFYGITNVPIVSILKNVTHLPTFLIHDADSGALVEKLYGRGIPYDNLIYIHIAYGIGAGFILNGKLFSGFSGRSGEIGHTSINFHGPVCSCGKRGCLELYASIPQMQKKIAELLPFFKNSPFQKITEPSWNDILKLSLDGDPIASIALDKFCTYLSYALTNTLNLLDFSTIIIGYDSPENSDILEKILYEKLKSSLNMPGSKLEIFHSRFNGEAPLLGSIAVVANEIFSHQLKLLP